MRQADRSVVSLSCRFVLLVQDGRRYALVMFASAFVSNNVGEGAQHEALNACVNPLITLCERMSG